MAQNYVTRAERELLDAAFLSYNTGFMKSLTATTTWSQDYVNRITSVTDTEMHEWLGLVPGFVEMKGERRFRGMRRSRYSLKNKDFEGAGIRLPRNQILDSGVSGLAPMSHVAMQAGFQAAKFPDRRVARLLKLGHTSAREFRCYDGLSFFNAAHPIDGANSSSTFRNYRTSFALTEANFNTAVADITSILDENGEPLGLEVDELLVPPNLRANALIITTAALVANAAGTAGVENINRGLVRPRIISDLAGTSSDNLSWYLTVKGPMRPFVRQVREPITFKMIADLESEHCRLKREVLMGADGREAYGFTLPQLAFKGVG
jgi:phage major head subunit gpT-like protein